MEALSTDLLYQRAMDVVEVEMHKIGLKQFEVQDFFCPGMYVRTVHFEPGDYAISELHATEHPFYLGVGSMTILTEDGGEETIEAPYLGITKKGTKRFARANTYCIWTTFHATDKTTVEEVEQEVIIKQENTLLMKQGGKLCRG